jgi:hypothetical protein
MSGRGFLLNQKGDSMSWLKKVVAEIAQDQDNAMNASPTDDIIDVEPEGEANSDSSSILSEPDHPLETLKKLLKGIHADNISFSYKQTEDGKRVITIELPSKSKQHMLEQGDVPQPKQSESVPQVEEIQIPEGPQTQTPLVARNKTDIIISEKQKNQAFLNSYVFRSCVR